MKMLVTSDWHLDVSTAGVPRFRDIQASIDFMVQYIANNPVDVFAFLGDVCNPDCGTRSWEIGRVLLDVSAFLSKYGVEQIWLAGNHDVIEREGGGSTLDILQSEVPSDGIHVLDSNEHFCIRRYEEVRDDEGVGICVSREYHFVCMPFVSSRKSRLAQDTAGFLDDCANALKNDRYSSDWQRVVIAMGHLNIEGATVGSETTDFPRGREVMWQADKVDALNPDLRLNGHYHARGVYGGNIHVPGSMERLTFGEEKNDPGFFVVEI